MSIKKYHQRKTLVICVVLLFITGLLIPHLQGQFRLRQVLGQKGPLVHEVWNKTYGGMYSDAAYSMKVTSDGGFIILGTTASFGCYNRDVWLLKTDVDGTEEWNRTFDGIDGFDSGSDILITNNDGYVIAGVLSDLPPPPDEQFIIDGWLIKTNQTGYEEWNRSFGGGDDDFFHSVQQTTDGGYAILGETMSFGSGGFDLWLVKTDSNGNELWNKTYGTSLNEYGEALLVTSENGLILVGIKIVSDDIEVWVIKTDSMGNILWNNTYGQDGWDLVKSVQRTDDLGFLLVGEGHYGSDNDLFLIKLDMNGTQLWNATFDRGNNDSGESVLLTSDSHILITGSTETCGSGNRDLWLVKTDKDGIETWNITFGGSGFDKGNSIALVSENNYVLCGITESFGAGGNDMWLLRVREGNHPPSSPTITGPSSGRVGMPYSWKFLSTDPENDNVIYYVDWGDVCGAPEFYGPYQSGQEIEVSHTYQYKSTFIINARAIDIYGAESNTTYFEVIMPKNAPLLVPFILRFFERYPHAFPLLRRLLCV